MLCKRIPTGSFGAKTPTLDHWLLSAAGFLLNALFCLLFWMQVIILIGNKADLEAQRDVTYEEAKQFAEENGTRGCTRVAKAEPRAAKHLAEKIAQKPFSVVPI